MREEHLLTGRLEPTNEGYAVAKIIALELCKMIRWQYGLDAIILMPTNLYGSEENCNLETSHVLAALVRKIHEAKVEGRDTVEIWGLDTPRRDFLHVDDLADAVVYCLRRYSGEEHLNVGVDEDISVNELAELLAEVVGWEGEFAHNMGMPDSTPRKVLDTSRLSNLGSKPQIPLRNELTYTLYEYQTML